MKSFSYIALLVTVLFSANTFAVCTQGGKTYSDGAKVGPFVCSGGSWVRR